MSRQHAVGINLLGRYHDQAEHQVQKNLRAAANPDELSAVRIRWAGSSVSRRSSSVWGLLTPRACASSADESWQNAVPSECQ